VHERFGTGHHDPRFQIVSKSSDDVSGIDFRAFVVDEFTVDAVQATEIASGYIDGGHNGSEGKYLRDRTLSAKGRKIIGVVVNF